MNTHHNESNFNLSIDDNFQNSEIFPFFGITNVESKEYTCTISFVVSSSEDIEVDKVIDFIKDFIPAQLEEFDSSKHLETFKKVNDKVSEVLAETLEGDSFIDVSISYVLIKNNYFYVSLDEGFNLIIFRNGKEHKIRKTNISPLSADY